MINRIKRFKSENNSIVKDIHMLLLYNNSYLLFSKSAKTLIRITSFQYFYKLKLKTFSDLVLQRKRVHDLSGFPLSPGGILNRGQNDIVAES